MSIRLEAVKRSFSIAAMEVRLFVSFMLLHDLPYRSGTYWHDDHALPHPHREEDGGAWTTTYEQVTWTPRREARGSQLRCSANFVQGAALASFPAGMGPASSQLCLPLTLRSFPFSPSTRGLPTPTQGSEASLRLRIWVEAIIATALTSTAELANSVETKISGPTAPEEADQP